MGMLLLDFNTPWCIVLEDLVHIRLRGHPLSLGEVQCSVIWEETARPSKCTCFSGCCSCHCIFWGIWIPKSFYFVINHQFNSIQYFIFSIIKHREYNIHVMSCPPVKDEFNYTVNYSSESFTMRWDSKQQTLSSRSPIWSWMWSFLWDL